MSFGYSVGDAVKLIELSTKIYLAFNDARQNSADRVYVLVKEFDRFHEFLGRLDALLKKHGKKIPFGYDDFKKTLLDCQSFIKPYADRLVDKRGASLRGAWRTVEFTFRDEDVARLRAELAGHYQTLTLCMQFMQLELQFESKERAVQQLLSLPATTPIHISGRTRFESRASITTIPENDVAATQSNADEHYHFLSKFHDFLLDQERRLSPASLEARDPFSHQVPAGAPDQSGVVLSRLRNQVDIALERAENRVKRSRVAGYSPEDHSPGSPGHIEIVETSRGSPNIQINHLEGEGLWSTSGAGPYKPQQPPGRRETYDSGLGPDEETESIHSMDTFRWSSSPGRAGSSRPPRNTRESVSSIQTTSSFSSGGGSSRNSSVVGAVTPGTTPLHSPTQQSGYGNSRAASLNGDFELPPAAIGLDVISDAAEVEYKLEQGWRKPSACTVSTYIRQQDGGRSLKTSLPNGDIYQHLPVNDNPIPQAIHDLHNPHRIHISFPAGRLGAMRPASVKDIRYTFNRPQEAVRLQNLLFGQELIFSSNVKVIHSDRFDAECRNSAIRLWQRRTDVGMVVTVLFYTNTREYKGKDRQCWIKEPHTAFQELSKSTVKKSSDALTLEFSKSPQTFALRKIRSRSNDSSTEAPALQRSATASSASSRASAVTVSEPPPLNEHKLKRLEITFKTKEDRRSFVDIWQSFIKPLVDV